MEYYLVVSSMEYYWFPLKILGSCTITDLRRWYNSALCI